MRLNPKLPTPPRLLRQGPFREGAFHSRLHGKRTAVRAGIPLATTFTICFLTGLISHVEQHPPTWLDLPSRPIWGYRLTQGVHVASGLISIPLLLVKLWTVYPKLFQWPPAKSVLHALERLSIGVLVACGLFELFTGMLNTLQWYPWPFPFIQAHYWVAWILVGALMLHIAVKLPDVKEHGPRVLPWPRRRPLAADGGGDPPDPDDPDEPDDPDGPWEPETAGVGADALVGVGSGGPDRGDPGSRGGLTRRGLVAATATAVGVVAVTTVGQSFTPLGFADLLAPRSPDNDPQGLPLNRTAHMAGVTAATVAATWKLQIVGPKPYTLTLAELQAMPQYEAELPIACVEGWSKNAHWSGVRVMDLLDRAGVPESATLMIESMDRGAYGHSVLDANPARDPLTLLALKLNGQVLSLDHGYPTRLIAPFRPGAMQTKWVTTIKVMTA